ncbi:MAG: TIGR00645 family protein [Aeromicrobium sp.]
MTQLTSPPERYLANYVGSTIFFSRWLQAPLYLGLIVAQGVYVVHFWIELWHLVEEFVTKGHISENAIMLTVLGLVDVIMIANLLIMVIIGGYETFVSHIKMDGHPDQPEWLSHVNPNVLKVKLAMSIIGISSIHLLATFLQAERIEPEVMKWQTIIHMAFIASAIGLAYIDRVSKQPSQPSVTV